MCVVLMLLVGALLAHGHPTDHSGNGLEFVLRNISALWEEVNDLRQEVNHHLHDGHSELSHDQIMEETAILQHEHHVHHLNHPHEGHNDHHNNEMLQHLSTHHGHQRGGQPGHEDPSQDDGSNDDDQDSSQEAAPGPSTGHPEDDHDRHGLHSDEDGQDPLQDDDDPVSHTHCLKCQHSHGHGHKHKGGHAHGRGHGHAHGHDHGPGHTHEHEEGHEHGDSHENGDGHEHGPGHGHGHAHGHSHAHRHDHGPGHTHEHEEGHEHGESHENEDGHEHGHSHDDHDHKDPDHNRLHSDENTSPGRRPQQQQRQERWVHAVCKLKPNADLPSSSVRGNITISQRKDKKGPVYFDLDLTGFDVSQGRLHGFHIHENPASEYRCGTAGAHFNPFSVAHGGPSSTPRHVGDLGNIEVDENGELHGYIMSDTQVAFLGPNSIINKAIVVHAREDDLGLGGHPDSLTTGNAGGRLACCNISLQSRVKFRFKG
ncbi:hypothetical protein OTU49_009631 [Cherax quadricarinatus]|uniref:Superoxide dismutase copper/zinc binding domain-containing protein n=1 Tax=Cherax quadricarinatus TaxID=27406 RepID=A0AAW0WK10_CHEQU